MPLVRWRYPPTRWTSGPKVGFVEATYFYVGSSVEMATLWRWAFSLVTKVMRFEDKLAAAVGEEAQKLALRYHAYHNQLELEHQRKQKRVASAEPKHVKTPDVWRVDPKFYPIYRALKKGVSHIGVTAVIDASKDFAQ